MVDGKGRINKLMVSTFAKRRQSITERPVLMNEMMKLWPALFLSNQVCFSWFSYSYVERCKGYQLCTVDASYRSLPMYFIFMLLSCGLNAACCREIVYNLWRWWSYSWKTLKCYQQVSCKNKGYSQGLIFLLYSFIFMLWTCTLCLLTWVGYSIVTSSLESLVLLQHSLYGLEVLMDVKPIQTNKTSMCGEKASV